MGRRPTAAEPVSSSRAAAQTRSTWRAAAGFGDVGGEETSSETP